MDMGMKLEHVLRHLKNAEPAIEHWMEFGDVGRSAEIDGVLPNAGSLGHHMVDGLVLAVYLLAKKCAAMEQAIAGVDIKPPDPPESRGEGAQSRQP